MTLSGLSCSLQLYFYGVCDAVHVMYSPRCCVPAAFARLQVVRALNCILQHKPGAKADAQPNSGSLSDSHRSQVRHAP